METTVIKELAEKKNLQTYIDDTRARFAPIFWPSLLTVKNTNSLRWDTIIGDRKAGVAGNVTAYNVSAPLHGRDAFREANGKIPSIRGKRAMDENDLLHYIQLSKQVDADGQRALELIFDDVEFCSIAPHKRVDWMLTRMISTGGKINFVAENNVGVVTNYDVDFGMPAQNITGTTGAAWSDKANSTPLTDLLESFFKPLADSGNSGGIVRMHPSKVFELLESDEVLIKFGKLSNGNINNIDLDLSTVNAYLTKNNYPAIRPFNASIGIENDGVVTYSNPFEKNNVVYTPEGNIGRLHVAPIVEKERPKKEVSYAEYLGNLVKKYSVNDPIVEFTAYEFNAFPSFDTIDQCRVLKTDVPTV